MDKTFLQIIRFLEKRDTAVSSAEIADNLRLSTKTILSRIKKYGDDIQSKGGVIKSRPRVGISLEIQDQDLWNKNFHEMNTPIFSEPQQRMEYIILSLLLSEEPIALEDFSEKLYSSYSTVGNDLVSIRQELASHNLELINVRGKGYLIQGKESDLRKYFSMKIRKMNWLEMLFDGKDAINCNEIELNIKRILAKNYYHLSDNSFENLSVHIYIMINRIKNNKYDRSKFDENHLNDFSPKVKSIAEELADYISTVIDTDLPVIEIYMLMIQLSAKQVIANKKKIVISDEILEMVNEMLILIKNSFHIDMSNNIELTRNLALHLVPLNYRLEYNIKIENPLVEEIKKNFPLGYILSNEASKVISNKYGKQLDENEIALLALHLNLGLQRVREPKQTIRKKRVLIICGTGIGTAKMLEYQIMEKYGEYIKSTNVSDSINVDRIELSQYDCLISTTSLRKEYEIPSLHVNYFLTKEDFNNIENLLIEKDREKQIESFFSEDLFFVDIKGDTKNEVIREMIKRANQIKELPDQLLESILKREELFSTEIGNGVAIPHPFEQFDIETQSIISILEHPIKWDKKKVQFIMIFMIGKNDKNSLQLFYQAISSYLVNSYKINKIIKEKNYNNFIEDIKENNGGGH
ncbi:PRD domain-containing protein [Alkalibacterium sp. s-m-22]